jgi:hypothetical protein
VQAHGHHALDPGLLEEDPHDPTSDGTVGPGHHDDLSHGEIIARREPGARTKPLAVGLA